MKVAINGLGRIGRCVLRALFEYEQYKNIDVVAVNGPSNLEMHKHLIKYDSIHGTFKKDVQIDGDNLVIDGKKIKTFGHRDPKNLPWKDLGVDIVLECTGAFTDTKSSLQHIEAGAKKVIISAPAKDDTKTIVYGVNHDKISKDDLVLSAGSCTTNCLAPMAMVLDKVIGIEKGLMTTIHAYTNDQNVVDGSHKDMRRARACGLSMIPTSTGAANAIGLVLPNLRGKLDGVAVRVPTPNVSMVDLNFLASKKTTVAEVNDAIKNAVLADKTLASVMSVVTDKLVSIDFNHTDHSCYYDSTQTKVLSDNFVKVAAWYDNEWAFSLRMLDIAKLIA